MALGDALFFGTEAVDSTCRCRQMFEAYLEAHVIDPYSEDVFTKLKLSWAACDRIRMVRYIVRGIGSAKEQRHYELERSFPPEEIAERGLRD